MTVAARALRLDDSTWRRMAAMATLAGAGLIVGGAYLVFAFDRFGMQGFFEIRATVRMMLTGLYGWLWLVGASWAIARFAFGYLGSPGRLGPLMGHAHLPLLLLAVFIQFVSIALTTTGLALWLALFTGLFWMPAMLVSATMSATDLPLWRAGVAAGVPYLAWALVVGRSFWTQLEHLL
ncbi:MAG: hypothetical protein GY778_02290 [bacterium]|nr:hypothetical protein [bacterium]